MNLKTTIKTTIICALLLNLLVLSAPQLISVTPSVPVASASIASANFLPNNRSCLDTINELTLSLNVAQYVSSVLDNCFYYYGDACTVSAYCSLLSLLKNNYDEVTVFSKGHRGVPYLSSTPANSDHRSLLDHYGDDLIDSAHIYPRTSSGNVVTFIWHCETALKYPSSNDTYGWYGMPYCWTHDNTMEQYNDTGSQVFLGWTNEVPGGDYPLPGGSPQYEFEIVPDTHIYAHVAYYFWYYMTNGDTVEEALDNLCDDIYNDNFEDTDLNGWLVAWGNIDLELP
jgi:hypothetical protein